MPFPNTTSSKSVSLVLSPTGKAIDKNVVFVIPDCIILAGQKQQVNTPRQILGPAKILACLKFPP